MGECEAVSYRAKLLHNYHELTPAEKRRYYQVDRFKFSPADRFFFEGNLPVAGQMYLTERKALYHVILQRRPAYCFEIGTHHGGGSTFFLASAFARLGVGQVITLEKDDDYYNMARAAYQRFLPGLLPFVTFLHGDRPELFMPFIEDNGGVVECVFLDGSIVPEETLEQYEFFKPFWKPGSLLMAHDWGNLGRDPKMTLLSPIMLADPQWSLLLKLGAPESVGFVVWQRR